MAEEVTLEDMGESKFVQNEKRKADATEQRVDQLKAALEELYAPGNSFRLKTAEEGADMLLQELESGRDLSRIHVVVDMDAFYVSVEVRDNPELVGKPVAVGGMSMLSTSSYEARKFGVRAAMPGFTAKKLCPELIIVPGDHRKYQVVSAEVMEIIAEYDPQYSAMSLDEAYLDLTDYCESNDLDAETAVMEMRRKVHEKTMLTCSAGIGASRMLAKIASDVNKPNGQYYVNFSSEACIEFMKHRPVKDCPGIGKVTSHVLNSIDINTFDDMITHRAKVFALFSPRSRYFFLSAALGISHGDHSDHDGPKSVSVERTFQSTSDLPQLLNHLQALCEKLMKRYSGGGKTVTLKMKRSDFQVISRQATVNMIDWSADQLFKAVMPLLKSECNGLVSLRLLGVKISGIETIEKGQRQLADFIVDHEPVSCPICDCEIVGDVNGHIDDCLVPKKTSKKEKRRLKQVDLREFAVPSKLLSK